jgi:hypothetical protein
MIEDLPILIVTAIKSWKKHNNGELPNEIFVFKAGASEGQFSQVLNIEFGLIQKGFDEPSESAASTSLASRISDSHRHCNQVLEET